MTAPVIINDVFSPQDVSLLRQMLADEELTNNEFYDNNTKRLMITNNEVTRIFGEKLEPHVREVFKDDTAVVALSFYCIYDTSDSYLPKHKDRHACEYNISYTLTQKEPWAFNIDEKDYYGGENSGIFYSGTKDVHGREKLGPTGNEKVEMIFFHFIPKDHWYLNHCEDVQPKESE
jgi:hypothetical protein